MHLLMPPFMLASCKWNSLFFFFLTLSIGNLTVGPNSTLSCVVDGNGASILMVSGCLSLNGSRLELQLQQEPQAGQYDVASTACLVGRPAQVVGVRIFKFQD